MMLPTRTDIYRYAPTVLTITACAGVIGTGITAARAGARYRQQVYENMEDPLKTAIKESILPVIFGSISIGSFLFSKQLDKTVIAALSVGTASSLNRIIEERNTPKETSAIDHAPLDTIIIDEDGELYYESLGDIYILMTPETFYKSVAAINKNLTIRTYVSLYEYYRLLGIKKRDILAFNLVWTKFVGWDLESMSLEWENYWLHIGESFNNDLHTICWGNTVVPLCNDGPSYIYDRFKVQPEDLSMFCRDITADEIETSIAADIQDDRSE